MARLACLAAGGALLFVYGCGGSAHRHPHPYVQPASLPATDRALETVDQAADSRHAARPVIHVVKKGQTLWRIARAYDVPLDELARVNGIADTSALEVGQQLIIPGAEQALDVCTDTSCLVVDSSPSTEATGMRAAVPSAGWTWPLLGRIGSQFGEPRGRRQHKGLDILTPTGTPVRAVERGIVRFSGVQRGFGRVVIVDHGRGLTSLYAHNSRNLVRKGDRLEQGQIIASSGQSGNATAPHLHFEMRRNGVAVDPLNYLTSR